MKKAVQKELLRHAIIAGVTGLLFYLFYLSRTHLATAHRFWRATGDVGFVLLFLALCIGPLSQLWSPAKKLIPWRRQLGIWFTLTVLVHTISIFDGWIQWNWLKFFGFEYIPQLGQVIRLEPGFGLANLIGLIALFFALIIALASTDRALRYLGPKAWKWLQNFSYVVFYLSASHAIYYVFIHFTTTPFKQGLPPNWFRYWILTMTIIVMVLQISAFVVTVVQRRKHLNS